MIGTVCVALVDEWLASRATEHHYGSCGVFLHGPKPIQEFGPSMCAQVVIEQHQLRARVLLRFTVVPVKLKVTSGRLHAFSLVKREWRFGQENCFSKEKPVIGAVVNIQQRNTTVIGIRAHNMLSAENLLPTELGR